MRLENIPMMSATLDKRSAHKVGASARTSKEPTKTLAFCVESVSDN